MQWRLVSITTAVALSFGALLAPQAHATFSGRNGLIVYFDGTSAKQGLWTLDPR